MAHLLLKYYILYPIIPGIVIDIKVTVIAPVTDEKSFISTKLNETPYYINRIIIEIIILLKCVF